MAVDHRVKRSIAARQSHDLVGAQPGTGVSAQRLKATGGMSVADLNQNHAAIYRDLKVNRITRLQSQSVAYHLGYNDRAFVGYRRRHCVAPAMSGAHYRPPAEASSCEEPVSAPAAAIGRRRPAATVKQTRTLFVDNQNTVFYLISP